MSTAEILTRAAQAARNYYQIQRLRKLTTIATKHKRISSAQFLNINLLLLKHIV